MSALLGEAIKALIKEKIIDTVWDLVVNKQGHTKTTTSLYGMVKYSLTQELVE